MGQMIWQWYYKLYYRKVFHYRTTQWWTCSCRRNCAWHIAIWKISHFPWWWCYSVWPNVVWQTSRARRTFVVTVRPAGAWPLTVLVITRVSLSAISWSQVMNTLFHTMPLLADYLNNLLKISEKLRLSGLGVSTFWYFCSLVTPRIFDLTSKLFKFRLQKENKSSSMEDL